MLKEWIEESKKDPEYVCELLKDHLAVQLKQLMIKKGIGKKELARRIGTSPSYVTSILSGENISLKTIAKILVALEESNLFLHLLSGIETEKYKNCVENSS
jgi:DNA-binding Xre family transcriptional regulator